MDATRIPAHLALRICLESSSAEEAARQIQDWGVASSCYIIVADRHGAVGMEFSAVDVKVLHCDEIGRVVHTNHYLVEHPGVVDTKWLQDSDFREKRIKELSASLDSELAPEGLTVERMTELFKDESGFPTSICRTQKGEAYSATLFNIVTDLRQVESHVTLGRPSKPEEQFILAFNR